MQGPRLDRLIGSTFQFVENPIVEVSVRRNPTPKLMRHNKYVKQGPVQARRSQLGAVLGCARAPRRSSNTPWRPSDPSQRGARTLAPPLSSSATSSDDSSSRTTVPVAAQGLLSGPAQLCRIASSSPARGTKDVSSNPETLLPQGAVGLERLRLYRDHKDILGSVMAL